MIRAMASRDWLRRNLFSDVFSGLTTLVLLAAALRWLPGLIDWMLLQAVFRPDAAACHAVNHGGACWGVVAEKYRVILFGRYPHAEQWRPLLATALLLAAMGMLLAFPLAIGVALGRQSDLPLLRGLCAIYVELVRGVPLISVLFLASFLFPIILPQGVSIDVLLRV